MLDTGSVKLIFLFQLFYTRDIHSRKKKSFKGHPPPRSVRANNEIERESKFLRARKEKRILITEGTYQINTPVSSISVESSRGIRNARSELGGVLKKKNARRTPGKINDPRRPRSLDPRENTIGRENTRNFRSRVFKSFKRFMTLRRRIFQTRTKSKGTGWTRAKVVGKRSRSRDTVPARLTRNRAHYCRILIRACSPRFSYACTRRLA